jgi:hypothetical protein
MDDELKLPFNEVGITSNYWPAISQEVNLVELQIKATLWPVSSPSNFR